MHILVRLILTPLACCPGARRWMIRSALLLPLLVAGAPLSAADAADCEARSGTLRTRVVELYTSEGCSSCPPADRWLSRLSYRPGASDTVLPLAFHVTYWDRLGWADRFASPAHTERQYQFSAATGSAVVYTPQVIVDGVDWRGWPALPPRSSAPAAIDLQLSRDRDGVVVRIGTLRIAAPQTLSGYWVLVEDGHRSNVRAGENSGTTLRHDHVVRAYQPVGRWSGEESRLLRWQPPQQAPADPVLRRRIGFVVVEAASLRPLQALALEC